MIIPVPFKIWLYVLAPAFTAGFTAFAWVESGGDLAATALMALMMTGLFAAIGAWAWIVQKLF